MQKKSVDILSQKKNHSLLDVNEIFPHAMGFSFDFFFRKSTEKFKAVTVYLMNICMMDFYGILVANRET